MHVSLQIKEEKLKCRSGVLKAKKLVIRKRVIVNHLGRNTDDLKLHVQLLHSSS
jgi:hypothetical protein